MVTFNPGEEKSFNFSFTGQNQDSVLVAKIRPVEVSEDANWGNNSLKLTVPASLVNLVMEKLAVPKSPVEPGPFNATATFRNDGNRTVTAAVRIYGDGDVVGEKTFSLAPGRRASFTAQAAVGAGRTATLRAVIDPNNAVKETDETNNTKTAKVTAEEFKIPELPDEPPQSGGRLID